MRCKNFLIIINIIFWNLFLSARADNLPLKPLLLDQSKQLILIIVNSWVDTHGTLYLFTRKDSDWEYTHFSWPVLIGSKGLAWSNEFKNLSLEGPIKQEGDNKSPTGAFLVHSAYGFAPEDKSIKLPYIPITSATTCVDNPHSQFYGQVIDKDKIKLDVTIKDRLINQPQFFKRLIIIDYNLKGQFPRGGSCIFVHLKDQRSKGTKGCITMDDENLTKLWTWLNSSEHPVLVQFPIVKYTEIAPSWGLPPIPTN